MLALPLELHRLDEASRTSLGDEYVFCPVVFSELDSPQFLAVLLSLRFFSITPLARILKRSPPELLEQN